MVSPLEWKVLGTLGSCKGVLKMLEQTVLSVLGLEGAKCVGIGGC